MTRTPCGLSPQSTDGTCGRWNCAPCHPASGILAELRLGRQQAVQDFLAWLPGAGAKLVNEVGMDIGQGARAAKLVERFLMERP